MKNLISLLVFSFCLSNIGISQPPEQFDFVNSQQSEVVSEYLRITINYYNWDEREDPKSTISPSYMSENGFVDNEEVDVNMYSPEGSAILEQEGNMITAILWGTNELFTHKLTFNTVKEKGKWYILPPSNELDFGYFDPWATIEEDIEYDYTEINKKSSFKPQEILGEIEWDEEIMEDDYVDTDEPIIEVPVPDRPKGKREALIYDFILAMIQDVNPSSKLKEYIAPSYLEETGFGDDEYFINSYTPVSLEIEKVTKEKGIVNIIGQNKNWSHKLYFDIVKEGGKWYIMPESREAGTYNYVDPWTKMKSNY